MNQVADDKMIQARLDALDGEERMYSNFSLDIPVHISWERALIARIEHLKEQLDHQTDRIMHAKEHMMLVSCPKCSHLHQHIHVCYMCGYDYYEDSE